MEASESRQVSVVATREEWQELANEIWNAAEDPDTGMTSAFLQELERLGILP